MHKKSITSFNRLVTLSLTLALISVKTAQALALRKRGAEVFNPEKAKVTVYIGRMERKNKVGEKIERKGFDSLL